VPPTIPPPSFNTHEIMWTEIPHYIAFWFTAIINHFPSILLLWIPTVWSKFIFQIISNCKVQKQVMNNQHNTPQMIYQIQLDTGSGTVESAVEFNLALDRWGLIYYHKLCIAFDCMCYFLSHTTHSDHFNYFYPITLLMLSMTHPFPVDPDTLF
jgi:hypothetical protein